MTLIRYNDLFPRFFDDNFTKELDQWFGTKQQPSKTFSPAVNVKEEKDAYQVEVVAPGMKKEDFKVEIDHDLLKISAKQEANKEEKEENAKYTRREFHSFAFERSFRLPKNEINGDKIEARYVDGILYLNLPKREEAKEKPARLIDIA
jgi:HSP20 family protein